MKAIVLVTLLSLVASSAFASEDSRYSAAVGVQAIARTVVQKKLVYPRAQAVIKLALETGRATLGDMVCDRALGADICEFKVTTADETSYILEVHLRNGTVTSARWSVPQG